jgi:hypothetical protein
MPRRREDDEGADGFFAFPLRWWLSDGSMVRFAAEIDEDDLNDVPDRNYKYGVI